MIKKEVIEYAKNLYLSIGENGKHLYSLQEIATNCNEELQKINEKATVNKTTVLRWSRKYNWDYLYQDIKFTANNKSIQDSEDKEEAIKDARSSEIAEIVKEKREIRKRVTEIILDLLNSENCHEIPTRDLINLLKITDDAFLKLIGFDKDNKEESIKSFMESFGGIK